MPWVPSTMERSCTLDGLRPSLANADHLIVPSKIKRAKRRFCLQGISLTCPIRPEARRGWEFFSHYCHVPFGQISLVTPVVSSAVSLSKFDSTTWPVLAQGPKMKIRNRIRRAESENHLPWHAVDVQTGRHTSVHRVPALRGHVWHAERQGRCDQI